MYCFEARLIPLKSRGTLDWTFIHVVAGLIDSYWLRAFKEYATHHLNDEYEQWNKQNQSAKDFT